jgi:hypothetical protein
VDGELADRAVVASPTILTGDLDGSGWHALVLEVPQLLETEPPQGLELLEVALSR